MTASAEEPTPKRVRGKIEKRTRKTIKAMGLAGSEEQKMLVEQALAGAKIMDEAMTGDRKRYIVSTGHRLQREALEGLRASMPPPPPPPVVEVEDEGDLEILAMHHRTSTCQPAYPLTTPGVCVYCDEATRAVGILMGRHPGTVPHDFSVCLECNCPECVARRARWAGAQDEAPENPSAGDFPDL